MKSPYTKEVYAKNAYLYKVLANPIRLEILNCIKNRELSVEQLIAILGLRKANVSQHLTVLRHLKLVTARRHGLNMYYRIVDPVIVEPCKILQRVHKLVTNY
jgi:DNA-binding transcriptional ArsR family regulator